MLWCVSGAVIALVLLASAIDVAVGFPTLPDLTLPIHDKKSELSVCVIVPALNEEKGIEACLRSLLQQDHGALEIIAVDDRSTDSTGLIMDRLAAESPQRLRVLHITELPEGWLGKPHAMWRAAATAKSDFLLFTDGDVIFARDAIRRSVAFAEESGADHLAVIPTLIMHSAAERMMIAFVQMGFAGVRPWRVADPKSRSSFGAGAFNMVKRSAYEAVGTFAALRLQVIEDLKLAERIKRAGSSSRVAAGRGLVSLHWAEGAIGIAHNLTKNLFAFFGFRWYLVLAAAVLLLGFHAAPFLLVFTAPGWCKAGYAAALLAILSLYVSLRGMNNIPWYYFLLHPAGALLFAYAMLRSTVLTLWRGGVVWRGTKYSLAELRRGA